jgi:hypothetical protein
MSFSQAKKERFVLLAFENYVSENECSRSLSQHFLVKHNAWPDYPSSDDLLYLGSRAKAFIFDWPKNSLLQEQSDHYSSK